MKAITIRRLASALLACVFVFSAFMAGTLAWTSLGQSAINEAQGSGQKSFPVDNRTEEEKQNDLMRLLAYMGIANKIRAMTGTAGLDYTTILEKWRELE